MHLWFDLVAYLAAAGLTWLVRRQLSDAAPHPLATAHRLGYLIAVTHGVIIGAVALGTANLYLSGISHTLGKSILGAIVGGIIAVEWFKAAKGISGSTGAVLVPGIALGIVIGRLGCFYAGLDDHTFGIASNLPWAVDQGDGVRRHPVALYEALAMLPLMVVSSVACWRADPAWLRRGFYLFALYYSVQRFGWEFVKPYGSLALGLNLFQWLCLALAGYALVMLAGTSRHRWLAA